MRNRLLAPRLRDLASALRKEPLSRIPSRLAAIAKPKLLRLSEEVAGRTPLGHMLGKPYRGTGIVVMLHEVHRDVDAELKTGCSPAQIVRVIKALRAAGRDIVTPDEGVRRLAMPGARPFAVITFDDGYRDNLTNALPVFEELNAPMTVFVPTSMITRELYAWWLGLRHCIIRNDTLDLEPMAQRFSCRNLSSKILTLRRITSWIGDNQARANSLTQLFQANGIRMRQLVDRYALSDMELRQMANHPLVTIGAHTETHPFLAGLTLGEARQELQGNKAWLEGLLDQEISYLAFPFGTPGACGEREAGLAAEAGFRASFTTRPGQLFPEHINHLQLRPRIDVGYASQSASALSSRLTGFNRALITRFGNPVATLS